MAQQTRKQKRWIYIVIPIGVVLIAIGVFLTLKLTSSEKQDSDNGKEQVVTQTTDVTENRENTIEPDDEEPKVKQYEGENPNKLDNLTGAVTYAGIVGGRLTIRVNIDQYLSEGSCILNLKQNGAIKHRIMAPINGSAATATCEGFDVSLDGLATGIYQIEVELSSGDKTGIIESEVTI